MVTVLRDGGLRVVIYLNDHEPPHVHLYGDGETKIILSDPPEVARVVGARFAESRRALQIVQQRRRYLLQRWHELHG